MIPMTAQKPILKNLASNPNGSLSIVMVRGIVSESYHWWDLPQLLNYAFHDIPVYTPEIKGNGPYNHLKTDTCPQKNVIFLREQISCSKKKILVGFSLGGMLCLEWAQKHPDEVAGVILVNSSLNNSPFTHRLQPKALKEIIKVRFIKDTFQSEKQSLMLTTNLRDSKLETLSRAWSERSKKYPPKTQNFFRQLYLAHKAALPKAPMPQPVLLINSKQDRVVNPRCSERIAKALNAKLVTHSTAGHDLFLEDPKWALKMISEFINYIAPSTNPELARDHELCNEPNEPRQYP
jgi:pimeloyl-[acyl-carrier protein] methyl ester esterase